MDTVVVDGKSGRVHRDGPHDGVPLLYLHSGFGEAGALPLFAHLADAGFRVTAPELPGFGPSDPAPDWHGVEDAVFHLRRLVDVLGLDRPVVVGSSLGGWLAAELAVWFPEQVRSLVLAGAVGLRLDDAPIFDFFKARHPETMRRVLPNGGDLLALLAPAYDADDPTAALLHLFNATEATARIGWNPFLHDPKLLGRLPLVTARALVLWGAEDGIVPRAHAEAYSSAIPDARLEIVDGSGHLPALEQPAAMADRVAGFVGVRA